MSNPYRIAIAGLGTVGVGVVKIIQKHAALIEGRAGRCVEIVAVSSRDKEKDRGVDISTYDWVDDMRDLAARDDIDAVVEMVGGSEGPAKELVEAALKSGKAVITANKALLAEHGDMLSSLSDVHDAPLAYEAAVAGGIPIIKSLREGFAGNEITAVYGILNGTCNYILTEMRETGRDFSDVLPEAQEKGYAEADPTFDVEGVDAAHKVCLLSALSFGVKPSFKDLQVTGISKITSSDIENAARLGCKIKLLGMAKKLDDGRIIQTVEPCLVPADSQIGGVEDVFNAVYVQGDFVDKSLLVGRGAGEGPTASAVLSDIIDLARGIHVPVFGVPAQDLKEAQWARNEELSGCFYMHVVVEDKSGVLAAVSSVMSDNNISVEVILQRGEKQQQPVSIVIKTHETVRGDIQKAADELASLEITVGAPSIMRIEEL